MASESTGGTALATFAAVTALLATSVLIVVFPVRKGFTLPIFGLIFALTHIIMRQGLTRDERAGMTGAGMQMLGLKRKAVHRAVNRRKGGGGGEESSLQAPPAER